MQIHNLSSIIKQIVNIQSVVLIVLFVGIAPHSVAAVDTLNVQGALKTTVADLGNTFSRLPSEGEGVREIDIAPAIIRKSVAFVLPSKWKYHTGDDPKWASPAFDDRAWEWASTDLSPRQGLPETSWTGVGWFRLWISVDSTLVNTPIALLIDQKGASEVYLDGRLLYAFGTVGTSRADEKTYIQRRPRSILFGRAGDHLIAVRYSNFSSDAFFAQKKLRAGFLMNLGDLNEAIDKSGKDAESDLKHLFLFVGLPLFLGVLHLLLFLLYPRARENLYYSFFVFCFAVNPLRRFGDSVLFTHPESVLYLNLLVGIGPLVLVAALRLSYAFLYEHLPKQFWIFLALGLFVSSDHWQWISLPRVVPPPLYVVVTSVEILRVICLAFLRKKEGMRIIGVGFLGLLGSLCYAVLLAFKVINPIWNGLSENDAMRYGMLCLVFSMSVYLAYKIARTSQSLEQQLVQVQELSEKTLEQERRIQKEESVAKEAQLRSELAEEQTQRKSVFLASISHELRTPMNAIKGFTNLVLRREKELSDRNRENLEKVTQASDHLLAMINDILDLSKIEAGRMDVNPEPFNAKALVATCCATVSPLLEEKPDVQLEYDVADGLEQVNTDQGRIRQMLINLLSNAIKFTDSGSVTVLARQENDQLVLSVSDTGQGIPDDEVGTIFDEYRQVKGSDREHKGTGLGLSITKQFAELLGGTIAVESEVGKGATFTVRIPVKYEEI
jgi:signal transduction histidine kinase